jgi:tRNA threonylcarbamoyladenosine biosynthesis protein TsaB
MSRDAGEERLLLIDTCDEAAGAAVYRGADALRVEAFGERRASAEMLGALRRLLTAEGLSLSDFDGVGVVSGPGSFTGVRTGLAAAKGLCEAAGLPLAAVSRLEMLAEAAGLTDGFAVLDAGRGSLYVREQRSEDGAREFLLRIAEFEEKAGKGRVVVAEERLMDVLANVGPRLRRLTMDDLIEPVRRSLKNGGTDVMRAEANYVRAESEIYSRRPLPSDDAKVTRSHDE